MSFHWRCISRAVSEQFQSSFRADSEQLISNFRIYCSSASLPPPNQLISEQIRCALDSRSTDSAVPEQFQSDYTTKLPIPIPEQFRHPQLISQQFRCALDCVPLAVQFQSSSRAIPGQFQGNSRAIPGQFQSNFATRTVFHWQCNSRAVPEQFPSNFRATLERFQQHFANHKSFPRNFSAHWTMFHWQSSFRAVPEPFPSSSSAISERFHTQHGPDIRVKKINQ